MNKKRRKAIRKLTLKQFCRACGKPVADHWLGLVRCDLSDKTMARLRGKKLASGALYSAFVAAIRENQ